MAFLAAEAVPFLRRISTAASMSPLASVSAFLQSIKPAPVISRSLPTSAAVNSAMIDNQLIEVNEDVKPERRLRRACGGRSRGQGGSGFRRGRSRRRGFGGLFGFAAAIFGFVFGAGLGDRFARPFAESAARNGWRHRCRQWDNRPVRGSQLVSTRATMGIFRRRPSATALCSRLMSTTNMAAGYLSIERMPSRFLKRRAASRRYMDCSCLP